MNRGKAGGWACALLDEDRYCTVESEEGSHCGRIYGDLPVLDSTAWLFLNPTLIAREREGAGKTQREKCASRKAAELSYKMRWNYNDTCEKSLLLPPEKN